MKKSKSVKEEKSSGNMYMSLTVAFILFVGITLIAGMTTFTRAVNGYEGDDKSADNYLQSSLVALTCVNAITALVYYVFLKYLNENKIELEKVASIRYVEWLVTVPLLLISFALYSHWFKHRDSGLPYEVDLIPLIYIIPLAIGMLLFGLLGESGKINKKLALFVAAIFFGFLIYFVYFYYVKVDENEDLIMEENDDNLKIIFWIFTGIWFLYGIAYMLPTLHKNSFYNILDIISKAGFTLTVWISIIVLAKSNDTLGSLGW